MRFFALGALVKHHPIIEEWIRKHRLTPLCVVTWGIVNYFLPFHYRERSVIHAAALMILILGIWVLFKKIKHASSIVFSIGKASMGIYVLHYVVLIYLLSSTSFRLFHITEFMQSVPVLTITAIIVVTFIVSFSATLVLRKFKWTKILIGG